MTFIVALTGASGAAYGLRLIEELLTRGHNVDMITSVTARLIIKDEVGLDLDCPAAEVSGRVKAHLAQVQKGPGDDKEAAGTLNYYPSELITAPLASGSALRRTMVIAPCSMGTLGRIASGVSFNLIDRSADCVLKEKGELVLVARETPLNAIHLENMLKLSRAGAVIIPAMPAFYHRPNTIADLVDMIVGRVLDRLGIENTLFHRWGKNDGSQEGD